MIRPQSLPSRRPRRWWRTCTPTISCDAEDHAATLAAQHAHIFWCDHGQKETTPGGDTLGPNWFFRKTRFPAVLLIARLFDHSERKGAQPGYLVSRTHQ